LLLIGSSNRAFEINGRVFSLRSSTDVRISAAYRAEFSDREYQTRPGENVTVFYGVFEGLAWQLNRKK